MEQLVIVKYYDQERCYHYSREYVKKEYANCSTCDKYFRVGGLGCQCGTSFYCNAICANKDINHYLVCSKDFHTRVKYILTLAIQKGIWVNNISRPTIIIKKANEQGDCKKLLSVCTFSHVQKHIINSQYMKDAPYGCLFCGNLTKDNDRYETIVSEGRKKVNAVMCDDCYTHKIFICKISMLPSSKCLKSCIESLAKKLIELWRGVMQVMGDYVSIDIFTCFSKFMFMLDKDGSRLLELYVENHVCNKFFV